MLALMYLTNFISHIQMHKMKTNRNTQHEAGKKSEITGSVFESKGVKAIMVKSIKGA